jgi:Fur family ferric uptake transcriptional regulator
MATRQKYRTKQQAEIIEFLEGLHGAHVTARDIIDGLRAQGSGIGTATVYRQVERLVEEGLLLKFVLGESDPACYEYVGPEGQCGEHECFHCLCTQCGKLIHMECGHLSGVSEHLMAAHGFTVDPCRTVFYGICEECAAQQRESGER